MQKESFECHVFAGGKHVCLENFKLERMPNYEKCVLHKGRVNDNLMFCKNRTKYFDIILCIALC